MDKEDRILQLNRLLANLFVLYIKFHRYSWYVKGEQSTALKGWFEQNRGQMQQHIDDLAELILIMDGQPFATMEKYVKETTLKEATADDETIEILNQLKADASHILQEINELLKISEPDYVYRVIVQAVTTLEKTLLHIRYECKQYLK